MVILFQSLQSILVPSSLSVNIINTLPYFPDFLIKNGCCQSSPCCLSSELEKPVIFWHISSLVKKKPYGQQPLLTFLKVHCMYHHVLPCDFCYLIYYSPYFGFVIQRNGEPVPVCFLWSIYLVGIFKRCFSILMKKKFLEKKSLMLLGLKAQDG